MTPWRWSTAAGYHFEGAITDLLTRSASVFRLAGASAVRWIIAVTTVVVALFGSAWTNVMITLAGMVREDLHELRGTLDRALAQVPPPGDDRHGELNEKLSWTSPPGPSSPRRSCCWPGSAHRSGSLCTERGPSGERIDGRARACDRQRERIDTAKGKSCASGWTYSGKNSAGKSRPRARGYASGSTRRGARWARSSPSATRSPRPTVAFVVLKENIRVKGKRDIPDQGALTP